jgi:drug/metabolite transporter (DMT)-like permease
VNRRLFYGIAFTALAVFDTATQVSFKLSAHRTGPFAFDASWFKAAALSPWIYVAIAGYVCAFVTWMTLLKHAPVGPSFAASHIDVVTVLAVSVPLFGERLAPAQLAGAGCVVLGIVLLSLSESKQAHA